jgi:ribosome recycling factor
MIEVTDKVYRATEQKMQKTVEILRRDLAGIRTGRASPSLLDRITVDYYGTPTPINQMATVTVPEPRLIVIQPWDRKQIPQIEKAIQRSDLGVNPVSDGTVIRLALPPLTEERRRDLVKQVRKRVEEARVAIRNERRDGADELKKAEREHTISEDEAKRGLQRLDKLTETYIAQIDEIGRRKEEEVMEV